MKKIFLSTYIPPGKTAGTKAREDVKQILEKLGYHTVYFPKINSIGGLLTFWRELSRVATKDSHLVLEYPCTPRKRILLVSLFSYLKGVKLYGVIHDVGDLRFPEAEQKSDMNFLKRFDGLISHNPSMTAWLRKKGYRRPVVDLQVFDYCLENGRDFHAPALSDELKVLYAGNLTYEKATFIYDKRFKDPHGARLFVYGQGFEQERMNGSTVNYMGVFNPSDPNLPDTYHFGLIWEGTSVDTCEGRIGRYIRFNNPHKFSLYISLGLPVIVWEEAAIAPLVIEHGIGFTIRSFADLDNIAAGISDETYREYRKNIAGLSEKVRRGFFLEAAIGRLVKE